jgi:ribonuclease HII
MFNLIQEIACDISIIFIDSIDVDKLNPKQATIKAMERSVKELTKLTPDIVLIDAEKINTNVKINPIIKGDEKSISIAAASIVAKVTRDKYMDQMDVKYPQYGFKKHKGYGTLLHLKALKKYGPIKNFHRFSYTPVKKVLLDLKTK